MKFEIFYSRYHDSLKAFLRSKVSDEDDVDDLLQDILIKSFNKIRSIKSGDSIKPWLFQIANHTVIDFYRRRARLREVHAEQLWYNSEDQQVRQSLEQCVVPLIDSLPKETSALLTAIDLEAQSQKDYAVACGVSYSTLKSRVQKARVELRVLFDKCCDFTHDKHGNIVDFIPKSKDCGNC